MIFFHFGLISLNQRDVKRRQKCQIGISIAHDHNFLKCEMKFPWFMITAILVTWNLMRLSFFNIQPHKSHSYYATETQLIVQTCIQQWQLLFRRSKKKKNWKEGEEEKILYFNETN